MASCNDCIKVGPVVPTPPGCCGVFYSGCMYYNGPELCIGPTESPYLNYILALLSEYSCQAPNLYAEVDYSCLSPLNITDRVTFNEAVITTICDILGTYTPSTVVSLSTLNTSLINLDTTLDGYDTQTIVPCYDTLSVLSGTSTLSILVADLQQTLCTLSTNAELNADKLVKISATDTTSGYLLDKLEAGTGVLFNVVAEGSNESLQIDLNIGLEPPVVVQDTASVDLTSLAAFEITGSVKIDSAITDNFLVITPNGLFASPEQLIDLIENNVTLNSLYCTIC